MSDLVSAELGLDVAGNPAGPGSSIRVDIVASVAVDLPGLRLAVERLRASLSLALRAGPDGLELPRTPELIVLPPTGASAELDLPGFGGGGYLTQRDDEWQGTLAARLGPVSVSGFGILTTKPYSMLVLLAAEFTPPIQLSFGFTLVGVGGLVGINRRPDTRKLAEATSSGDLSRLLFPRDPIAEAPRLLPVLKACFPESPGDVVVGPMVKIGWGTPTIVAATIAVLASSDGVVIVGRVAITLPFEQASLIRLEALVLGTIDENGLFIGASLANSHIVGIPVEGDIRVLMKPGNDAVLALSAGGFHPSFTPPDRMGGMKRISAEVSYGPLLRARLSAYLAVTTNSVQFGAGAELVAGIDGFGIRGHFAFDALIRFDPFGFMADFSAGVSIECADFEVGSITLSGHFSGPSPWRIRGHATVSILWWDIDVDIPELTMGTADAPPPPPARDPLTVLHNELQRLENWTASTRDVPPLVRLRPGADRDGNAVHPMSSATFRQGAVPLDIDLQRMDGVPLPVATTLQVRPLPGQPGLTMRDELFPPSQFREQDDKAKLSSSGYARFHGGFDVGEQGARTGAVPQTRTVMPETSVLGEEFFVPKLILQLPPGLLTGIGHLATSRIRTPFLRLRDPGAAVVASARNLHDATGVLHSGITAVAQTTRDEAMLAAAPTVAGAAAHAGVAEQLIDRLARFDRAAAADLQVVRAWETVSA